MGFSPGAFVRGGAKAREKGKKIKTAFPAALKALLPLLKQGFHVSEDRFQIGKGTILKLDDQAF
jgi:hypothetical protein